MCTGGATPCCCTQSRRGQGELSSPQHWEKSLPWNHTHITTWPPQLHYVDYILENQVRWKCRMGTSPHVPSWTLTYHANPISSLFRTAGLSASCTDATPNHFETAYQLVFCPLLNCFFSGKWRDLWMKGTCKLIWNILTITDAFLNLKSKYM